MTDPIYVTATEAKASVAMFFFPECNVGPIAIMCLWTSFTVSLKVNWMPAPHLCIPPREDGLTFADERIAKIVLEATIDEFKKNDLLLRVLDDYLPMELLQVTIGSGAVKQLIAQPGKTHQVYSQLRNHTPIPNVKIYYTAPKVGDLPEWYHYKKSSTVPDLVLVAQPGYAIVTRDFGKQIPPATPNEIKAGMSGYNNHYPDMLGVFLAYGPVFRKGYHKGPLELCDVYTLMCSLLRIDDCNTSCGR
ncbi:hypothetical protein NECAME_03143 [Necator americanus]|uniref:glycerophosphocholine cholinephosphodiesterase n=1 Tax=Necator americanus TaxID=51031 RepID=W2T918_NECAM|nr:hypothetical protein NECAME_03143 [Necator americanus]ETN77482.1 hypothetical protein NECAME_03143 [Necator americanus]